MSVRVWHGWRGVHNGKDISRWEWIEFDEDRTDERVFYRLYDGRIVVAEHRYGDWEKGGVDYGVVSVYADLDDAARRGWRDDLVRIGAYDAPTLELDEWLSRYEEEE